MNREEYGRPALDVICATRTRMRGQGAGMEYGMRGQSCERKGVLNKNYLIFSPVTKNKIGKYERMAVKMLMVLL